MTVGELKSAIEELDDDVEVRIVLVQSHSSLEYRASEMALGDIGHIDIKQRLYISTGSQIGYASRHVMQELGHY